ncbi:MAG: signal peptidase I [Terriglobia bacterium]
MNESKDARLEETAIPRPEQTRRGGLLSFFKELPFLIIGAFVIAWVVKSFVVQPFKIEQQSMVPTLHPADRVFVNKFLYRFSEPQRGDIVTFRSKDESRILIKRIIATEGEVVEVRKGNVFVDERPLREGYVDSAPERIDTRDFPKTKVPENSIFVMGDNRPNSGDSRMFGPVPETNVLGKAFLVYWPAENWQLVK